MSILIKGMETPKDCWNCRFADTEEGGCLVDQKTHGDWDEPDECPLVPVPPHGRLIDADELLMHRFVGVVGEAEKSSYMVGWNSAIETVVENAHTVIEGEKKSDG